jgi:peroxiredoxin
MKNLLIVCILMGFVAAPVSLLSAEDVEALKIKGEDLSRIEFPVPDLKPDREYLGLPGTGSFRLPQIAGSLLVIEIFSMYCPYCQAEAERVNILHKMIQNDPTLKGKVKLIGIGSGNTPFEVSFFRKKYQVPFPLFHDEKKNVQKCANKTIRTPTFVTVGIHGASAFNILDIHVGKIADLKEFLKSVSRQLEWFSKIDAK